MAASQIQIINMALGHLNQGKSITSLDEDSQAADVAGIFYDEIRDMVLAMAPWPFAKRTDLLGLVETNPTQEWGYSYRYPTGCLMFRRFLNGLRTQVPEAQVSFTTGQDESGRLIYTDVPDAIGEWTTRITDVTLFPPHFVIALSYALGATFAPILLSSDTTKRGEFCEKKFQQSISKAKAVLFNEMQADPQADAEWVRNRGGGGTSSECYPWNRGGIG